MDVPVQVSLLRGNSSESTLTLERVYDQTIEDTVIKDLSLDDLDC